MASSDKTKCSRSLQNRFLYLRPLFLTAQPSPGRFTDQSWPSIIHPRALISPHLNRQARPSLKPLRRDIKLLSIVIVLHGVNGYNGIFDVVIFPSIKFFLFLFIYYFVVHWCGGSSELTRRSCHLPVGALTMVSLTRLIGYMSETPFWQTSSWLRYWITAVHIYQWS